MRYVAAHRCYLAQPSTLEYSARATSQEITYIELNAVIINFLNVLHIQMLLNRALIRLQYRLYNKEIPNSIDFSKFVYCISLR